jgi:predicted small secreted protein
MMKTCVLLALLGFAAAECPNACSGHGTCGS